MRERMGRGATVRRAGGLIAAWLPLAVLAGPGGARAQDAAGDGLALREVVLSSGGVGQFSFAATVDGAGTLGFDVPLDQVDDVLASLVVQDPAGGIPIVRLAGREPLVESFRTLPFSQDALASPEALLGALVGAEVRLPGATAGGSVLSVSPFEVALPNNGGTLTRHRLAIATAAGVETVVLEDVPGVEIASPELRAQIGRALAAIAANRAQDQRRLEVALRAPAGAGGAGPAAGRREVRLGYVVAAPVWKATWRLALPPSGDTARLQGLAVVENLSGRDWRDVALTLTSGQPVLYHQPLYEALFAQRPEAPVEVANRLTPRVDAGDMAMRPMAAGAAPPPPPAPAPMQAAPGLARRAMPGIAEAEKGVAPAAPEPPAQADQGATQVEFHLSAPVTALSGQSLLLPILDRDVPVRRVALYQPDADPLHPLVALEIRNDTGAALPPGLVTLLEVGRQDGPGRFVGDARLPAVQPGEVRLAAFAADLATRIDTERAADTVLAGGSAARGVLTLTRRERSVTTYRIASPSSAAGRTLLIEQPRRPGWTVAEPATDQVTITPTHWRIRSDLTPGGTDVVRVVLERTLGEAVALGDLTPDRLLAYAGQGALPDGLRAALRRAAELRAELDRRQASAGELEQRVQAIAADETRVRQNIAAVPPGSELARRSLAQLAGLEDELGRVRTQQDAARTSVTQAQAALRDFLATLQF